MTSPRLPGKLVTLSGEDFIVPPLNLASLERFQDHLGSYRGGIDPASVGLIIEVAHAALKRNYPELKVDDLKELVDLGNIQPLFMAVMNISLLEQKSGENEAPADPSTGAGSTPI